LRHEVTINIVETVKSDFKLLSASDLRVYCRTNICHAVRQLLDYFSI